MQGVRNGTYRDAVTGREIVVHDGTLAFDVRGSSAGIYVLDGPGRIGVDGVLSATEARGPRSLPAALSVAGQPGPGSDRLHAHLSGEGGAPEPCCR